MQQAWEFVRAKSADKYRYEIDKIEALFTINLGPAIYVCGIILESKSNNKPEA